ncbi:zinc finger ccch type domain protein, partial [Ichthyophthirius multifiliis]
MKLSSPSFEFNIPNSDQTSKKSEFFPITEFKTTQCQKKEPHDKKKCSFYHSHEDQRRCPLKYSYSINQCKNREKCEYKSTCLQVHNKVEQLYHPLRYRTKFCKSLKYGTLQLCEYGQYCSFAHSEQELVIPFIEKLPKNNIFYIYFYKTVWCPNTEQHERSECVYMHNVQDFRRDPKKIKLQNLQCQNWSKENITKYIEGGCQNLQECKQCHGWKEFDYHPLAYKTKPCLDQNCQQLNCYLYHNNNDRRIIS